MESLGGAAGSGDEASSRDDQTSSVKIARRVRRRFGRRSECRQPLKIFTSEPISEAILEPTIEDKFFNWWLEVRRSYHPKWQRPGPWKCPEARGGRGWSTDAGTWSGAAAATSTAPATAGAATTAATVARGSTSRKTNAVVATPARKVRIVSPKNARARSAPVLVAPSAVRACGPFMCYGLHNCYLMDAEHVEGNASAARIAALRKKVTAPKPFVAGGILGGSAATSTSTPTSGHTRRRASQHAPRYRDGRAFAFELDADEESVRAAYRGVHASPRAVAQINRRLRAQLVARAVPVGGSWSSSASLRVGELCRLRKISEGGAESTGDAGAPVLKAPAATPIFTEEESSLLNEVAISLSVFKSPRVARTVATANTSEPAKTVVQAEKDLSSNNSKSQSTSPQTPPTLPLQELQPSRSSSPKSQPLESPPLKLPPPKSLPPRSLPSTSPTQKSSAPRTSLRVKTPPSKSVQQKSLPSKSQSSSSSATPASSNTTSSLLGTTTHPTKSNPPPTTVPSRKKPPGPKRLGSPAQNSGSNKRVLLRKASPPNLVPSCRLINNPQKCPSKNISPKASSTFLHHRASALPHHLSTLDSPSPGRSTPCDVYTQRTRGGMFRSEEQPPAPRELRAGKLPKNRSSTTLHFKTTLADAGPRAERDGDGEKPAPPARQKQPVGAVRRRSESQLVHAARSETDKWLASRTRANRQTAGVNVVDLGLPLTAPGQIEGDSAASRACLGSFLACSGVSPGALGLQLVGDRRRHNSSAGVGAAGAAGARALPQRPASVLAAPLGDRERRRQSLGNARTATGFSPASVSNILRGCGADAAEAPKGRPALAQLLQFIADDCAPLAWQADEYNASLVSAKPEKKSSEVQVDEELYTKFKDPESKFVTSAALGRKSKDPLTTSVRSHREFSKLLLDKREPINLDMPKKLQSVCSQTQISPSAKDVETSPQISRECPWNDDTARTLAALGELPSDDVSYSCLDPVSANAQNFKFVKREEVFSSQRDADAKSKFSQEQNIAFDTIFDVVMQEIDAHSNPKCPEKRGTSKQCKIGESSIPRWMRFLERSKHKASTVSELQPLTKESSSLPVGEISSSRSEPFADKSIEQSPSSCVGSEEVSARPVGNKASLSLNYLPIAETDLYEKNTSVEGASLRELMGRIEGSEEVTKVGATPDADEDTERRYAGLPLRAACGSPVMPLSRPKWERPVRRFGATHGGTGGSGVGDGIPLPVEERWHLWRPQMNQPKGPPFLPRRQRGRPPPAAGQLQRPPGRHGPVSVAVADEKEVNRAPALRRTRNVNSSSLDELVSSLRRVERFS